MTLLDKLLQLLYKDGSLSGDDMCHQLGKQWFDIQESVGVMIMRCWVVSTMGAPTKGGYEKLYVITPSGKKEFDLRVAEGKRMSTCLHTWSSTPQDINEYCVLCHKKQKKLKPSRA